ncbi:MAG: polysaccharide biosynthesis C-terminal domain-containing protein [Bacteroidales bacterium]|jgi:O-antigen/teichoic acid export membrane protein|nr:polysaccharide biosynthesis C-terminal domain-containing protein [Bacteroidales bacterium]
MANTVKKLVGQTAIYGLSSMFGRLLNYFLVPLYTNVFLPQEYGIVTEFYAYVTFLIIVLTYGMETGFFRFSQSEHGYKKTYSTALSSLFITSASFLLLVNLFAQPIANTINYTLHPEWVRWFALILAFDAFSAIPFAKLRMQNKAKRFAAIKLAGIVMNVVLNVFFIIICPRIAQTNPDSPLLLFYSWHIGIGYIFISNLISSSFTLLLLLPDIFEVELKISRVLLKKMLWYSFPLLIGGLAGMINETIDRILLKYLLPGSDAFVMAQVGIYGANYKLAILMTLFIQMFRYAAEPFFFSSAKDKNSNKLFANVMTWFIIFGLLIFLGITGYLDIVKFFIGENYHDGLNIVPILLIANLFLGIYFNLSVWYKLNDKTRFGAYFAIIGAVITIILNVVLIPVIGYTGSAIATLVCYFTMMLISYFIGKKHHPIPYQLKKIAVYFIFAGVIFALYQYTNTLSQTLELLLNTALIAAFTGIAIWKERLILQIRKKST